MRLRVVNGELMVINCGNSTGRSISALDFVIKAGRATERVFLLSTSYRTVRRTSCVLHQYGKISLLRVEMADEMDLPVLPPDNGLTVPLPSTTSFRKRSRAYSSGNSSDVPMFSSDDLADASLDNYESPRSKRQHRRAWWDENRSRREQVKMQARRDLDSGIFMASDSSNTEDGFPVEPLPVPGFQRLEAKFTSSMLIQPKLPLQGEALVQKIIATCLEDGKETVDCS